MQAYKKILIMIYKIWYINYRPVKTFGTILTKFGVLTTGL